MKYALLLIGLAVLLFGCVVQPTGPLEESVKPPEGLDVKDALEDDSQAESDSMMESNGSMESNDSVESNGTMMEVDSEELSMHGSPSDCWVLYEGEVYDVTSYLLQHPGGAGAITPYCGKDDSSFKDAFEGQHGMSKVDFLMNMSHMGSHMGGGMMGN